MALRYDYTRLCVTNFAATFRFYRDVLGFTPLFGGEEEAYTEFESGPVRIALFRREMMAEVVGAAGLAPTAAQQDPVCLTFGVDDVDAEVGRLRAAGVEIIAEPTSRDHWGIRTAHFRDPDGNLLEVNQPIPRL